MLNKVLSKVSSVLYKAHVFVNRQATKKPAFKPYVLQYSPTQSSIKIIHINGNFIVGGSSQLIVDIIERTSDKYLHKVIVPDYPEPLPYQPVTISKYSITQMQGLFNYLKEEKPSLVHIHYWIRNEHRYSQISLWYQAIFKMCEELKLNVIQNVNVPTQPYHSTANQHNVFVSNYVEENFNKDAATASVIYPGSDFSHFQNKNIDAFPNNSIGMVYRMDWDKLNAEAIEVFISVVKKKADVHCYIIGSGYYLEYYKKRVKEERMVDNFTFTGMVSYSKLPEYYKKFGVFVAPVHDESFGQVTPFAMSMGQAIAGYNIGALSEILGYKDTLVEYGDIGSLADVIIDLVSNVDRRIKFGHKNQARAHLNFSVEAMIDRYKQLYEACIK
jgi:glycosyltransferase involved in cell wall biosynthesis